jgi:hypothetical protein
MLRYEGRNERWFQQEWALAKDRPWLIAEVIVAAFRPPDV